MLNKLFLTILAVILPLTASRGAYVGQLQENWVLPSDHMPIALNYDGDKILSWNVLHNDHMGWVVEKDSQGLKRSVLGKAHRYVPGKNITERDLIVIEKISKMRFDVLALQEASTPMLTELKKQLPKKYEMIQGKSDLAVVYDKSVYQLESCEDVGGVFLTNRYVQNIVLKGQKGNHFFRLINTHVPGDPENPAHPQLMNYLVNSDFSEDVIAIGDLNFNENQVARSLAEVDKKNNFKVYSPPYATNISPGILHSKIIDHAIVKSNRSVKVMKADYFDKDFQYTALLLDGAIRGDRATGHNQNNDLLRKKVLGH